jgi:hypothetical protein
MSALLKQSVDMSVEGDLVVVTFTGTSSNVERIEVRLGTTNEATVWWKHRGGHVNVWRYEFRLRTMSVWESTHSLGQFAWAIKRAASTEVFVEV